MNDHTIWIIDDDQSIRWVLQRTLQQAGFSPQCFSNADEAIKQFANSCPACIITDIKMPGTDGIEFMQTIHRTAAQLPVIVITAHADLDSAILAYDGGAFEYLPKPFDIDEVVLCVHRALAQQPINATKAHPIQTEPTDIIGESPAMQRVYRMIGRLSKTEINVLITGQSGSGKELVARALHRYSPRADKPFIALNMAAIPAQLLESELFGHEKGAFTGAQTQRQGRFEQANDGSLFLDEIGDMPMELQTRLLRVLSDGTFYRLGGHHSIRVNTRIIAATHQDLEQLIKQGSFREDLYHRLNVIRIQLPTLKERCEDIPILMNYFLDKAAKELSQNKKMISPEVEQWLKSQPWPGNVRQLENLSRWLTVMVGGHIVHLEDLPSETALPDQRSESWETSLAQWVQTLLQQQHGPISELALPKFERVLIQTVLAHTQGKKHEAAKRLGWGRNTLTRKLKTLGLDDSY